MATAPKAGDKPTSLTTPFRALVLRADPDWEAGKRRETFYEFSNGRKFTGDNARMGPYSTVPNVR